MVVHEGSLDVHFVNQLRVELRVLDDIGIGQELFGLGDCCDREVWIMFVDSQRLGQDLDLQQVLSVMTGT